MKTKVLLFIFALFSNMSYSQILEFEISKIDISNYKNLQKDSGVISLDDLQGPFLILYCKILNTTNNPITINPSKAKFHLLFNYEGKTFQRELYPLSFMDNISLEIPSLGVVEFTADEWLFIGTPIIDIEKDDYLLDLVKVLPTIELNYSDSNYKLSTRGGRLINIE